MKQIDELFEEMIEGQKAKVLKCGRMFVPTLTSEDMLQPCDYQELENNPYFRYEEGVLEGLMTAKTAVLAFLAENRTDFMQNKDSRVELL